MLLNSVGKSVLEKRLNPELVAVSDSLSLMISEVLKDVIIGNAIGMGI